jgi:hypothetical protein
MIDNKIIAVWFSCGAASAVAAKKTIELYGDTHEIKIVNNPVMEEHPDNLRFLKDVSDWLGKEIEIAVNPKFPNASATEVWNKRKYMSGVGGAPCTLELKKEARYHWEKTNHADYHVLGFTLEEYERARNFKRNEKPNLLWVLGNEMLTKDDCFRILRDANIKLPEIYSYGFPNANCIGCVKATSPTYWNLVREKFPDVFKDRARQSRDIGCRLVTVKGKRIFLDELSPGVQGQKIKTWECGTFCEEKK